VLPLCTCPPCIYSLGGALATLASLKLVLVIQYQISSLSSDTAAYFSHIMGGWTLHVAENNIDVITMAVPGSLGSNMLESTSL
jgi:hypothetical protein